MLDVKKENKSAQDTWAKQLDAIAHGVEIEYDLVMGYSIIVTGKTVQIARQLDIPEKQIQRWVALRKMFNSNGNRALKSTLDKIRKSSLAQRVTNLQISVDSRIE